MTSPDPPATGEGRPELVEQAAAVAVDQSFDVDGLYSLRATLAAHAPRLDISTTKIEHLLIVASELATNAIRHGGGTGRLRLWRDGDLLYCRVADHGPGIADASVGTSAPDQYGFAGRGMWICRQLCTEMIITSGGRDDPGTTVTAVISLTDQPDARH